MTTRSSRRWLSWLRPDTDAQARSPGRRRTFLEGFVKRLQEQQPAILAPADARARGRGVVCAVICVNGPEVMLLPLNATAERSVASLGRDVYLNFRHAGAAIALRGEFEEKAPDDVRFRV